MTYLEFHLAFSLQWKSISKLLKAQTKTHPLLPVSYNPNSNLHVLQSRNSHYITKVRILHIIILMITFGTILSLPSVLTSLSMGPQTPSFQINSLFLSNLNISNTTFRADWDATFKVENPNLVSAVHFNSIRGLISYKGNPLAMYSIKPLELEIREHKLVQAKVVPEYQTMAKNEWILEKINRQRDENGVVSFDMTMFVSATYTTGWWGIKNVVLNPQCSDLRVVFLPKTKFGSWVNGGPMKCSLPMM